MLAVPLLLVAGAAPPDWETWIDRLGHDDYAFPWWISKQQLAQDVIKFCHSLLCRTRGILLLAESLLAGTILVLVLAGGASRGSTRASRWLSPSDVRIRRTSSSNGEPMRCGRATWPVRRRSCTMRMDFQWDGRTKGCLRSFASAAATGARSSRLIAPS